MKRRRKVYDTKAAAMIQGKPERSLRKIQVVTIRNGPFKGRTYERRPDGSLGQRVWLEP